QSSVPPAAMGDEKSQYEFLPVPSYAEATSSRPASSRSRLGPEEVSDDAERQGLLSHDAFSRSPVGYHSPTVESVRSSFDFLPSSNGSSARGSTEDLRPELDRMDVEEPEQPAGTTRLRCSKRLTDFRKTLYAIHLPFRRYLPS